MLPAHLSRFSLFNLLCQKESLRGCARDDKSTRLILQAVQLADHPNQERLCPEKSTAGSIDNEMGLRSARDPSLLPFFSDGYRTTNNRLRYDDPNKR